ncbi:Uncharacterized protein conserved in bacteria [Serratia ficaria]|uniref:DUF2213 domain-containing protein n=1 Tax=Serratia ficaria TaxID=61651 RepID=UPI00217B506E|nr:DUF2213 domain-containing protein [Serratia ficaria]CAI1231745.1 Uncharacterized protein conserved in bacteria [Serratia ficaria]CAI1768219.1 Uncharacterized protein conserved in bacteria [Serratia ficaria]CAI2539737.1 Uncharacterized protein conserved in bacteria [Serratia ficaria]
MSRICVNVLSVINSASNITSEIIDGVEHIVVKDVCPVIDDIVLNGGLYPADEIAKGFKSLEGKPMPYGHPKIEGQYVSASNVRAVNEYHIGAFARNVRKEADRVLMDMCVNRRYAEATEKGKEVVTRLDDMKDGKQVDPIGVSTGLGLNKAAGSGTSKGKKYNWIATNQDYDHCAILLHETPAGTPQEGVGIFVNAQGDEMEIQTANLADASDLTREGLINKTKFFFTNASNFSFDDIQRALSQKLREGKPDDCYAWPDSVWPDKFIYSAEGKTYQQKYLIDDDGTAEFVGEPVEVVRKPTEYEIKTNGANNPMKEMIVNALKAKGKPTEGKTDAELFDAFNQMNAEEAAAKNETPEAKAARLQKEADDKATKDKANNGEEMPAWAKLLTEQVSAINSQLNANSDKEKAEKRTAVKTKFGMTDTAVNALDGEALNELFAKCSTSTGLNSSFRQVNSNETFSEMPE